MDIRSVIIEKEERSTLSVLTSSAILVEKKYGITTSNILSPFLEKNLELVQGIEAGKLHLYKGKNSFKFRVLWRNENESVLESKKVNIFGLFKCRNMEDFCKHEFKDWTVDFRENNICFKNLLSVFIIFAVDKEIANEEELKSILRKWLSNTFFINLNKGDRIICKSSPFGTRDFLNSLSEGIVSSILNKSYLILSDCSSTPGCEGGLIYFKQKAVLPVGIIIASLNWWRKEWAGFTLIADIRPILCQLTGTNLVINYNQIQRAELDKVLAASESCLAQVNCGTNWGTAILLSKEKGIFITNSHVVRHGLNIRLFWKKERMSASLIYQNNEDSIFDLAIIKCGKNITDMSSCDSTLTTYKTGDRVYCAGYPLFSTLSKPEGVTITSGVISDCDPYMIKTTCGVFPGFSGGTVLNSEGILLGIIVCNTRLNDIDVTYPKYNMAVPFKTISDIISDYLKNEDRKMLEKLETSDSKAIRSWMRLEGRL